MKWTLTLLLAVCIHAAFAQQNAGDVFYFDAHGRKTSEKKASRLEQRIRLNDTLWVFNFYNVRMPMTKSYECSDEQGTVLNGSYIHYDENGMADSSEKFSHGVRSGIWSIYTARHRQLKTIHYETGVITWEKDSAELNRLHDSAMLADSIARNGRTDTDKESQFTGGSMGWFRFMNKNFRYPDFDVNNEIMGEVRVEFIVDSAGDVHPEAYGSSSRWSSTWIRRACE